MSWAVKQRPTPAPRKVRAPKTRHSRGVLLSTLAILPLAACDDMRPLDPLATGLTGPVHRTTDHLALSAVDLSSQASLDALEARYRTRPGMSALVEMLELVAGSEVATNPVLLQRIALIRGDLAGLQTQGLEAVIAAGSRLRAAAPGTAEATFIEGWIPWRFVHPDDRQPLIITAELSPFVDAVREAWTRLITAHPDFRGPRGYDAALIRTHLAALDAATTAKIADAKAPAAPTAALPVAEPQALDINQLRALEALQRFASATDGERRSVCSAWPPELLAAPVAEPLTRLAFLCATLEGQEDEAVAALTTWMRLDGLTSITGPLCRQWRIIGERFGFEHLKASHALPPIDCP